MAIDISDPRYDDYSPDEPDQCEACGVYMDDEDVVVVRGVEPDMYGNIVLLNVCAACAPSYEPDPILTRDLPAPEPETCEVCDQPLGAYVEVYDPVGRETVKVCLRCAPDEPTPPNDAEDRDNRGGW